ncbi:hypothetical protein BH10PSE2_BH10PSE2_17280 [soil metagenome]
MSTRTPQIVVALVAAIAFVIAFISAGVALVSAAFALIGSLAIGWLVYVFARRILTHRLARDVTPT